MSEAFDLFGFLEARTFPTEDVTVYTNEQAALNALPILEERTKILKKDKDADVSEFDAQLKALEAEAGLSALTFHLRGVPQNVIDAAYEPKDDEGHNRVLAAMLLGVTGPDGNRSDQSYSPDDVKRLYGVLPPQGANTITNAVARLLVASLAFDGMADAGFLAKS